MDLSPTRSTRLEKPWLGAYAEGVPETLAPYSHASLVEVLAENAVACPHAPALIFQGNPITYAHLNGLSEAFGRGLVRLGVKPGDRVALVLPNCVQAVIAQFGAWKAGAIIVPLNPLYPQAELEQFLNLSGATVAVALTPFYRKVKTIQPQTALRMVIAANIKEYLPPHLRFLFTLLKEKQEGHAIQVENGDYWFEEVLHDLPDLRPPLPPVEPDATALLLTTGGTTGVAKLVACTQRAVAIPGRQFQAWSEPLLPQGQSKILWIVPVFHAIGNVDILGLALYGRAALLVAPNPRDINGIVALIEKHRPNCLPGVPTLLDKLLKQREQRPRLDLTCLRLSVSGAAFIEAELYARFEQATRGELLHGYGLTEVLGAVTFPPTGIDQNLRSAGVPLPDVELRIVDPERGEARCEPGEVGEVILRAPQMMSGYWQNPGETQQVLRDGWLFTGDLGYLDQAGFLFIVDRKKDVIKPSGFQVWPQEVESALLAHPAVAEAGVAGIPDEHQGEAVKAWVVLKEGAGPLDEETLREFCRGELAAYKAPRSIVFVSELPKSHLGKVVRAKLRQTESPQEGEK
jgi:long-chain acyl-CoA synthetase